MPIIRRTSERNVGNFFTFRSLAVCAINNLTVVTCGKTVYFRGFAIDKSHEIGYDIA